MSQNKVEHVLSLENTSLDSENRLKYFLGVEFKICKMVTEDGLMKKYMEQIDRMLPLTSEVLKKTEKDQMLDE